MASDPVGLLPRHVGAGEIRPEVKQFVGIMEQKLRENDHKAHWLDAGDVPYFMERTHQEFIELSDALRLESPPEEVLREAADVANMVMMVAQRYAADRGYKVER